MINAIIYFAKNTLKCRKVKLFKLLFFLDFEHFKQTGRSVTGLEYQAWQKGPVPQPLNREFDLPEPDLKQHIRIDSEISSNNHLMYSIVPLSDFDSSHFSKRELQIMENLANEFRDHNADQMIEATHLEGSPWHQVYEVEKKYDQAIPYEYVFPDQEIPSDMVELIREQEEIVRNYSEEC